MPQKLDANFYLVTWSFDLSFLPCRSHGQKENVNNFALICRNCFKKSVKPLSNRIDEFDDVVRYIWLPSNYFKLLNCRKVKCGSSMLFLSTLLSDIQEFEVLWIHNILVRIRILFLFVSGFHDVDKKFFSYVFCFLEVHLHHSSKIKSHKKVDKTVETEGFLTIFAWFLEGSRSISKTNFSILCRGWGIMFFSIDFRKVWRSLRWANVQPVGCWPIFSSFSPFLS
jgi:hypothetical protein